jgi:hypothetical protein
MFAFLLKRCLCQLKLALQFLDALLLLCTRVKGILQHMKHMREL